VRKEVDKSLETVTGNIHNVQNALSETRAEAEEHRDKESRRNNIILHKVPESNAARAEDRNKEDVSFCLRMFNTAMHVGLSDEDLAHIFRLGTSDDAPRPLMVQLASYTYKNLIMESLFRLKHADSQFKTVIVARYDQSRKRREQKIGC